MSTETHTCLNCNSPEDKSPLVSLRFAGQPYWICTRCLPTLIHKPYLLADKLAGAENFPVTSHQD